MSNLRKYLLSIAVVLLIADCVVFFEQQNPSTPDPVALNNGNGSTSGTTSGTTGTVSSTETGTSTASGSGDTGTGATAGGMYKDGSYTGTAADAFYGTIQVEAVVSGGALTDVQFLQYPNEPGHSTQVSSTALPQLKQEAIAAQSANVNVVSGATQDSQAFQQSLASALAQAKS